MFLVLRGRESTHGAEARVVLESERGTTGEASFQRYGRLESGPTLEVTFGKWQTENRVDGQTHLPKVRRRDRTELHGPPGTLEALRHPCELDIHAEPKNRAERFQSYELH